MRNRNVEIRNWKLGIRNRKFAPPLLLALCFATSAFGQISGAGQFECNAAPQTGTAWSSSTSINTTQTLASNVAGAAVTVVIDQTSTLTAGAISFQEDYGDGNLVTVNAWQAVDPTSSTFPQISLPYTLQASTNKVFLIQMGNAYKLVLKLTTAITGSGTITPYVNLICYTTPSQVNVANTVPVSGTFWQSTQPVSLSTLPSLAAGSNTIGAVTQATASNLNATVVGSLSNNGAVATSNFVGSLIGIAQTTPNNGTAATQGRNVAPNVGTDGSLWVNTQPALRPASYEASANFAASSTTDNACIYGNSTDTVVLYEVDVSGVQTTAGIVNVSLIRRSAAESGGTSTSMTDVRGDVTNYSAASTTPVYYTGTGPTVGTAVGNIDNKYTAFLASSTATPADLYLWSGRLKPQVLIGTSQGVCVNLGGALTGGTMSLTWRWLEISNISE